MIKLLTIFCLIILTYTITKYVLINQDRQPCNKEYYMSISSEKPESKKINPLKYRYKYNCIRYTGSQLQIEDDNTEFCNYNIINSYHAEFDNAISKLGDYY